MSAGITKAPAIEVVDLCDGRFALNLFGLTRFVGHSADECWARADALTLTETRRVLLTDSLADAIYGR